MKPPSVLMKDVQIDVSFRHKFVIRLKSIRQCGIDF